MKRKRLNILITLGLLMILAALCLAGYNLLKDMRASAAAADVLQQLEFGAGAAEEPVNDHMELEEYVVDGVPFIGVLEIPALGLQLPVASYWDEGFSTKAPCRYAGSPYTDDMIIAGHNFREHLGKIRSLKEGDEVFFTTLKGRTFRYCAAAVQNIDGTDIDGMKSGDWDLTLFTCTFGGQTRVAVRCIGE